MNAIAQVVGSLLMYGIARNTGLSIAPWRVMFIVCGAMTVAIGILFFFAMPSGPEDAWFLNQREKEVLVARMAERHEGGDHKDFSLAQLKEALLDYKVLLIFCFGLLVTMQSPVLTVSGHLLFAGSSVTDGLVRVPHHQGSWLQQTRHFVVHSAIWSRTAYSHLDRRVHVSSYAQSSLCRRNAIVYPAFDRMLLVT
jgi:MFS family permease